MKLLLIGNHTCANRGDCAILRGLIHEIERQRPDATLTIVSRSPVVAGFMLGRAVEPDPFAHWHRTRSQRFPGKDRVASRVLPLLMWAGVAQRMALAAGAVAGSIPARTRGAREI